MSLLIVYPADAGAQALAQSMEGKSLCLDEAAAYAPEAELVVLVSTGYYEKGCWEIKRWLSANRDALQGRLFACCICADSGELALRTLVSQLLSMACFIAPCACLGADGILHPGGSGQAPGGGWTPKAYYRKLEHIAASFKHSRENTLNFQIPLVG